MYVQVAYLLAKEATHDAEGIGDVHRCQRHRIHGLP